ncbi:hypothetical protein [Fodinicurvata sediminis]|uniref:hypothetical protein n=1 Tax=Fodinicurvata sediminis TaxID=1121832 RepID=UPI0003B45875|nr:hypothetical protein [Fodinicurvata sediminis]
MTSRKTTSKTSSTSPPEKEEVGKWESEGGAAAPRETGGRRGNALTRMVCRVFGHCKSKDKASRPSSNAS